LLRVLVALAGLPLALAAAAPASAASAAKVAFNLPAAAAERALKEFSAQSGLEVLFVTESVAGVRTAAVQGAFTPREALDRLLAGTPLVASQDPASGALRIRRDPLPNAPRAAPTPAAARPPANPAASPAAEETVRLDVFTVTGSNLRRIDAEQARPVTRVDADQISAIGAVTVAEILQTLPQVEASNALNIGPTAVNSNSALGDTAAVNLRGLDDGNTLVLLNGRRIAAHGISAGTPPTSFVNVNQIPSAAIERIEVLRDGASAIYGSDATGGVINFILKSDYEGTEVRSRYASGQQGYYETSTTVALGRLFNSGRTSVNLIASYFQRPAAYARDYALTANSDHRLYVGAPFNTSANYDLSNASGPYAKITRINTYNPDGRTVANGTNFFLEPTAPLLAPGVITPTAVTTVGGVTNEPPRPWNVQQEKTLVAGTSRANFYATLRHDLGGERVLRGEFSYYGAEAESRADVTAMAGNTTRTGVDNIVVPASNYWNPFGTRLNPAAPRDVLIRNFRAPELAARAFFSDASAYRGLLALEGKFAGSWAWNSGASFSRSYSRETQYNHMGESLLYRSLALNTPAAFNPFGGPGVNAPAVLDSVRIVDWTHAHRTLMLADAKVNGELARLPGGPLALAGGVEFRREMLKEVNGPYGLNDDMIQLEVQQNFTGGTSIWSCYAELEFPLVGRANARHALQKLSFNAAVRGESYGDFEAVKPALSAQLITVPWLQFRASAGEGFRAPSLPERFQPPLRRRATNLDPARQVNAATGAAINPPPADTLNTQSKAFITSGNPAIRPEDSESWNVGMIVGVPFVPRLTFTADFWGIRQKNRIGRANVQDELNLDRDLWRAGRGANPNVIRAARSPFDLDNNIPGILDYVNNPFLNQDTRDVQGYDLSLEYVLPTAQLGRFRFLGEMATYTVFTNTSLAGTKAYRIRDDGRPKRRATGTVSWRGGAWTLAANVRHVGNYFENAAFNVAGLRYPIASSTTVALNASYRLRAGGWLRDSTVRLGATNLLDRDPPFAPQSADGYDVGNASPLGRLVFLELAKKF
jgi:outer membrane receptor protein involved in Fe transport